MCLCTTCVPGVHGGQKMSDPMKLRLLMIVSRHVGAWAVNLDPLKVQSVFFTTEPFLQSATAADIK